jgi:hypothetical protein
MHNKCNAGKAFINLSIDLDENGALTFLTSLQCVSVFLYFCLFVSLSFCLSVLMYMHHWLYLLLCFVFLFVCLNVCLFFLFVCLNVCLSFCLSASMSVCLSVLTSVHHWLSLPLYLSFYISGWLSLYLPVSHSIIIFYI